jgi:hypothetical protein
MRVWTKLSLVLYIGWRPTLAFKTQKYVTYPKCESGLNHTTCAVHVVFRPTSVEHMQNVSLDSTITCAVYCVQAHKCGDIPKMWRQTWLAPCTYAPYSMNILTLGRCSKGKKFLRVFGGHLKPEGLIWCRGRHLFLFKKENYCSFKCFVHVKHEGFVFTILVLWQENV